MDIIGDYIYDADRLIFYPKLLSPSAVESITAAIPSSDEYELLRCSLETYNPNDAVVNISTLYHAGICLSNSCNLRCTYCGDSVSNKNVNSLSLEDIAVFLTDLMKRWKLRKLSSGKESALEISFSGGGEPTYNWELFRSAVSMIHQRCTRNSIPVKLSMTTNGMLTDVQREFISANFHLVMVSYDGLPHLQNKNRHSSIYPATTETVEDTIRYFSGQNLKLIVRSTVWQDDIVYLPEMADYLFSNFGAHLSWSILPVIPMGRALKKVAVQASELVNQDFLAAYVQLLEYTEEKYNSPDISTPIFSNQVISRYYCGSLAHNCSNPWLLPNKSIVTCIEPSDAKTVIGKVERGHVTYFPTCHDPLLCISQMKFTECRECIAYRFCRGGCPAKHLMACEHDNELKNWECNEVQKYWRYVFSQIVSGNECFGWCCVPADEKSIQDYGVLKLTRCNSEEKKAEESAGLPQGIVVDVVDGEYVLYNPLTGNHHLFNKTASYILHLIAQSTGTNGVVQIADIVDELMNVCNLPLEGRVTIENDVAEILQMLIDSGIVVKKDNGIQIITGVSVPVLNL